MPDIKINYDLVREMRQAFHKGTEELSATRAEMKKIVDLLESGGLVGQGGTTLSETLEVSLDFKLNSIIEKFEEMIIDLQANEDAFRGGDNASASEMS
jgi:hypothetical protein